MTAAQRLAVLALNASSFTLGLVMVSFPASSPLLKELHGFTDAEYGAIFIPQVILTVVGAIGGGGLAARLGVVPFLRVALATSMVAQLLLASLTMLPAGPAYAALLAATGSFGLAFGLVSAPQQPPWSVLFVASEHRPRGHPHPVGGGSCHRFPDRGCPPGPAGLACLPGGFGPASSVPFRPRRSRTRPKLHRRRKARP